jgi:membrane-associated phospholipid phosphatase
MSYRITGRALQAALLVTTVASPVLAGAQGNAPSGIQQQGAPLAARPADSTRADSAAAAAPLRFRPPAVFSKRDLALTAGMAGVAVALFPMDGKVERWAQAPAQQENGILKGAMAGAEWGVERGTLLAGAGLWVGGLAARSRTVADMGFHSLAAVAVSQSVTHVLKGTFGRVRPYASDSAVRNWEWGSGFREGSDRRSFPSGHTSHAFAFATAMSHEINKAWPRAGRIATPLLFTGATAAAAARVYHDKHWVSDVTLGAAVGILSARSTLRFLHGRPNNFLDRLALNTSIVPTQGGATVAFTVKH